jgi:hypothetical protein
MTVAVLCDEYRVVNEDGLLDFSKTVGLIRNIEAMMTSLFNQTGKHDASISPINSVL